MDLQFCISLRKSLLKTQLITAILSFQEVLSVHHLLLQRLVFLKDYPRLLKDYLLAKVGNINFLRITQRPVQWEVYELCDRLGLLVQTDFPAFGRMRRNTLAEALKQVQEMEHLIRSHPVEHWEIR